MNTTEQYKLTISEPAEFLAPDGSNIIYGKLIKVVSPECLIFESDTELEVDGIKGSLFILKTRYVGQSLKHTENYSGTVGIGILLTNNLEASIDILAKNSKYVFIGSLEQY